MIEGQIIPKWYAFVGGVVVFAVVSACRKNRLKFAVDSVGVTLLVFVVYLTARTLLGKLAPNDTFVLSLVAFFLLYYLFRWQQNERLYFDRMVLVACAAQALYGVLQYAGVSGGLGAFRVVGSFDNPAGFAACLSAGFPFCLAVIRQTARWKRYAAVALTILVFAAVFLSQSRAGVVAVAVVLLVYGGNRYFYWLKKHRIYFWLCLIVVVVSSAGLFFVKQNSALGRLLIWGNSCAMIAEKPLVGHGSGAFMGNYMEVQAEYFANNPHSPYAQLAGNVTHPFNEYLLLGVEYGVIGLFLMLLVAGAVVWAARHINTPILCLLAVAVFACFSYPLRYPFVLALLAYSIASINPHRKLCYQLPFNLFGRVVLCGVAGVLCFFLIRDIRFERDWGKVVQKGIFMDDTELTEQYAQLYARWNGDPMFLYNYGAVLNRQAKYDQSNNLLTKCASYFNSCDLQMIVADNYCKSGKWNEAERHYWTAQNMFPIKFMPLYRLMLLYEATENQEQAQRMAKTIIEKQIKIPSHTINEIRSEAQRLFNPINQ